MIQGSLTRTDSVASARGLAMFSARGNVLIDLFIRSYAFVLSVSSIPCRLYFRSNLGERAFSPFSIIVCIVFFFMSGLWLSVLIYEFISLYDSIHIYAMPLSYMEEVFVLSPLPFFLIYVIRMSVRHFKKVSKEADESDFVRYSYHRGESTYYSHLIGENVKWSKKIITDEYLRMHYETRKAIQFSLYFLLVGGIAIVIGSYFNLSYVVLYSSFVLGTGIIIQHSALCLYLEEFAIKLKTRGRLLDITDAEYDSAYIQTERSKVKLIEDSYIPDQIITNQKDEFVIVL